MGESISTYGWHRTFSDWIIFQGARTCTSKFSSFSKRLKSNPDTGHGLQTPNTLNFINTQTPKWLSSTDCNISYIALLNLTNAQRRNQLSSTDYNAINCRNAEPVIVDWLNLRMVNLSKFDKCWQAVSEIVVRLHSPMFNPFKLDNCPKADSVMVEILDSINA